MILRIESKVRNGVHAGAVQTPYKHSDGFYVVSPTRFEQDHSRVPDLLSVANAAVAGPRVRMKAKEQKVAGLIMSDSIGIDDDHPSDWARKRARE